MISVPITEISARPVVGEQKPAPRRLINLGESVVFAEATLDRLLLPVVVFVALAGAGLIGAMVFDLMFPSGPTLHQI